MVEFASVLLVKDTLVGPLTCSHQEVNVVPGQWSSFTTPAIGVGRFTRLVLSPPAQTRGTRLVRLARPGVGSGLARQFDGSKPKIESLTRSMEAPPPPASAGHGA